MAAYMDRESTLLVKDFCMGNFIRVDEIRVNCNFRIGQLQSLIIQEQMNSHTVCELSAGIESESLITAGQQYDCQPLVIDAVKDGKKILLFSGVIDNICIERDFACETVHIRANSLSWLMDLEKKDRSYQGESSVLKLIRTICKEQSFSLLCSAKDNGIEGAFIQYRETDWEFLKRLSTHLHVPVYVANDYEGRGIYLGLRELGDSVQLKTLNEKWCMDADRAKAVDFDYKKAVYYEVITGQVLHLGQNIRYRNEILWPFQVNMTLRHGMLYCTYKLAGKYYYTVPACFNPYVKGVALEGTVLERKNETIKVHLDIDEEQEIARAHFYPWMPEHGNLVYCMPEEGSRVRLLITGEDERDAIGIQCVRQNGKNCEETQIPSDRWFSTDSNKKLTLQPFMAELSSEEGESKISLCDNVGSSVKSCGDILLQAKGKIIIQGAKVNMNAPNEISIIKRELGEPAVVNICHNLDAIGKQTDFRSIEEMTSQRIAKGGQGYGKGYRLLDEDKEKTEKEWKKLQFELQKLMKQENEKNKYELGTSIVNVISAIPQPAEQDRLARIAAGFRPIAGHMKGE